MTRTINICYVGVKTLVLMLALTKYGYQVDASVSIQHLSTSSSSAEPSIIGNNRQRHLCSPKTTAAAEEDGGTNKKLVCGDQFRPILPSLTTQKPAPSITLATNGKVFSSDAPHLVSHVDRINNDGILRVVLPGTTDSPSSKSCLLEQMHVFMLMHFGVETHSQTFGKIFNGRTLLLAD